jgi:hypothetical protein
MKKCISWKLTSSMCIYSFFFSDSCIASCLPVPAFVTRCSSCGPLPSTHASPPAVVTAALSASRGPKHLQGCSTLQNQMPLMTDITALRTAVIRPTPMAPWLLNVRPCSTHATQCHGSETRWVHVPSWLPYATWQSQ